MKFRSCDLHYIPDSEEPDWSCLGTKEEDIGKYYFQELHYKMKDNSKFTYMAMFVVIPLDVIGPTICRLPVYTDQDNIPEEIGTSWKWNGNKESPVLTPSIVILSDPTRWHGFIKNNRLEACE